MERRAGDNPHPGWRAPTWPELAATVDERTSHGRWGELPYKTIWTAHTILARAVCEHGRAFALLLRTTPTASLALDTQARTMVELAAQASWLMWPDVGGRARVARLHVLRRRTAIEHDRLGRHHSTRTPTIPRPSPPSTPTPKPSGCAMTVCRGTGSRVVVGTT